MKRVVVVAVAALATGFFAGSSSVEAASKKHLIIVYSSGNTGSGTVTVDRGKLHAVPLDATKPGECAAHVCGDSYGAGTRVTLTATPAAGSTFKGWGGDCDGASPTCTIRLSGSRDVMAYFSK